MAKITAAEFAERMNVGKSTVSMWIKRRKIPSRLITRYGRTVMIDADLAARVLGGARQPTRIEVRNLAGCEDSHTTTGRRERTEHRWIARPHPYGGAKAAADLLGARLAQELYPKLAQIFDSPAAR